MDPVGTASGTWYMPHRNILTAVMPQYGDTPMAFSGHGTGDLIRLTEPASLPTTIKRT